VNEQYRFFSDGGTEKQQNAAALQKAKDHVHVVEEQF